MIFGVLNPEKIWHQRLVHLPTSPVYCSHFTFGNPKKSSFNSIIHSYFRLVTLSKKQTATSLPITPEKCRPHYLVKIAQILHVFICSRVSSTNARYGRVVEASCCNMGWISAEPGGRCSLSVTKDWKHVSVQRVVTLNICSNFACLNSICHTSQPYLFRATNDNPQPAFFRATNVWRNATSLQSHEKVVHFTR